MTGSKSVTVRWLVVLCLLGVVGVAWSLENKPRSGRDMTDQEMARLFGRQPDPVPIVKCQWCVELTTDNQCTGSNPCPKCVTPSSDCEDVDYWVFSGNRVGKSVSAGVPLDDWWANPVVRKTWCNGQYWCESGGEQEFKLCSAGGCGDNTVNTKCYVCSMGPLWWPTDKNNDYCDVEACED